MKSFISVSLVLSLSLISCNWAGEKAKSTLHKSGEIVGKAGSEVIDGVAEGVQESFANLVQVSPRISSSGIRIGQVNVLGTDSTSDNIVSVYLIFDRPFNGKISAKVTDKEGLEFGRVVKTITADSAEAKFIDFEFDRRTNIDRDDRVRLE